MPRMRNSRREAVELFGMNVASRQIRRKIGLVLQGSAERQAAIKSLMSCPAGRASDLRADWRHDDIKPQHRKGP